MALAKILATGALAAQVRQYKALVEAKVASVVIRAVAGIIAAAFLMIALVFGSLAVFYWLTEVTTPALASLWVAGGWLLIALLTWLIGVASARSRARQTLAGGGGAAPAAALGAGATSMAHGGHDLGQSALDKGYEMGAKVNASLARHPYRTVGVALAVGLAAGVLPRLRRRPPPRG